MNRKIFTTEIRNLLRDRSVPAMAVIFCAFLAFGLYNTAGWIASRSAQSAELTHSQNKALEEKRTQVAAGFTGSNEPGNYKPDPSDPYAIGTGLQYAVLPFTPSAIFAVGQSDVLPLDVGVSLLTPQRTKADKTGFENPLAFLFGKFDAAFVLIYILPLFILAISFNILSGEREGGTLQLLLSQPLSLKELLLSKVSAQFLFVAVLIAGGLIVGVFISGIVSRTSEFFLHTVLLFLLILAYAGFWFAIAVFINSFGLSSSTNAVAAATAWLFFVLVLPSLLGIIVSAVYPLPPRSEVTSVIRNINLDMRRDGERLLSEFYQDHPEMIPKDGKADTKDFGLAFVYIQNEHKKKIAEVEGRFDEQLGRQQQLVSYARFLSPAIITNEAINDIAGTGLGRYSHFREQAKEFDKTWSDYFRTKVFRAEKLTVEDFAEIPGFEFTEEPFGNVASRVGTGLLFLIFISVIFLGLAFYRFAGFRFDG